jgi:hypothetical protein
MANALGRRRGGFKGGIRCDRPGSDKAKPAAAARVGRNAARLPGFVEAASVKDPQLHAGRDQRGGAVRFSNLHWTCSGGLFGGPPTLSPADTAHRPRICRMTVGQVCWEEARMGDFSYRSAWQGQTPPSEDKPRTGEDHSLEPMRFAPVARGSHCISAWRNCASSNSIPREPIGR